MQTNSRRWGRRVRITPADVLCYGAVVALLAAVILALCAASWLVS